MTQVFQDIIADAQEIIRSELRLAAVEARQQLSNAAKAGRVLVAGLVLALYGLGFLLLTAVYGLETVMAPWLAALLVTLSLMIFAAVMISIGIKLMKQVHRPEKSINAAKENVKWAKQQFTSSSTSVPSAKI